MNKPQIISISAISGGGKTSVTKALVNKLNRAIAFYFDDYEYLKQPENIGEWIDNGSNPNAWNLSLIQNDIDKAIQSEKYDYVVIDYPFGKNVGYELSKVINVSILIDTPLDIALARRIVRDSDDKTKEDILNELISYPSIRRYFVYNNDLKKYCDFTVNGGLSISEIVEEIKAKL